MDYQQICDDLYKEAKRQLQELNNFDKQQELLKQYIDYSIYLDQDQQQNIYTISLAYHQLGNFAKGLEYGFRLLKQKPLCAKTAFYLISSNFYRTGQFQQAIIYSVQGYKLDKNDIQILFQLILCLRITGNYKESQKKITKLLKLNPNDSDGLNVIGVILYDQGKSEESFNYFQELDKKIPDNLFYNTNMGIAQARMRNYTLSLKYLEQAFRISESNPYIQYYLGQVYNKLKQYQKAIRLFEKQSDLNPTQNFFFIAEVGYAFLMKNQIDKATQYLDKAQKYFNISEDTYDLYDYASLLNQKKQNYNDSKKNLLKYLKSLNNVKFEASEIYNIDWSFQILDA